MDPPHDVPTSRASNRTASLTPRIAVPLAWFSFLAVLVLGPLVGSGYLLLLDSSLGPHPSSDPLFPLPSDGLVSANSLALFVSRLPALLHPQVPNKLMIAAVVIAGGTGLYRFARSRLGVSPSAALVAGTIYVINPFVYERLLAGHLLLALAYSLLPWALPAFLRIAVDADWHGVLLGITWTAVIALVDLHAGGWAMLLLLAAIGTSPAPWQRRVAWAGGALGATLVLHAFWIIPVWLGAEAQRLAAGDLAAYAPRPRSFAILPRVLLLHGFWRAEFTTPLKQAPPLFIVAFFPVVLAAIVGAIGALRSPSWRRAGIALLSASLIAIVLGMGISFPPTAGMTRALFEHAPGYGIYREPQKWIAVLALAYAVFSAGTFDAIASWLARRVDAASDFLAVGIALPLLATPMMLWGFGGQVGTSRFPKEWERAAEIVNDGDGAVAFLPWALYLPLDFAGGRIVANPAEHFFEARVLVADEAGFEDPDTTAEFDPRLRYVRELVARRADITNFGHLIAPLGARYVAAIPVPGIIEHRFFRRQADLTMLIDGDDLVLYENLAWRGDVYGLNRTDEDRSLEAVLSDPQAQSDSADTLVHPPRGHRDRLDGPELGASLPFFESVRAPGSPVMGTSRACSDGWQLDDRRALCHLGVVAAFDDPPPSGRLWRPGMIVQVAAAVFSASGALALGWMVRRRRGVQARR